MSPQASQPFAFCCLSKVSLEALLSAQKADFSFKWRGHESLERGVGFSSSSCLDYCMQFSDILCSEIQEVGLCQQAEARQIWRSYPFSHFPMSRHKGNLTVTLLSI